MLEIVVFSPKLVFQDKLFHWVFFPTVLGEIDENPEILQMQVIGASSCAHLYPDIGSSIVYFITQDKDSDTSVVSWVFSFKILQ